MVKKHLISIFIGLSLAFLYIATLYYPGGSQRDKNSIGYHWADNYLSNLFSEKAVNGAANSARWWAVPGMFFLCISLAVFFVSFSKRIPGKGAADRIVRYFGLGAMVSAFLAVTPYHDIMVMIGSTLALVSMFYITVFTWRSKLHFFKALSVICLLVLYVCNFVYYSGMYLELLPVLQKTSLFVVIVWALSLHYLTSAADFRLEQESTLP